MANYSELTTLREGEAPAPLSTWARSAFIGGGAMTAVNIGAMVFIGAMTAVNVGMTMGMGRQAPLAEVPAEAPHAAHLTGENEAALQMFINIGIQVAQNDEDAIQVAQDDEDAMISSKTKKRAKDVQEQMDLPIQYKDMGFGKCVKKADGQEPPYSYIMNSDSDWTRCEVLCSTHPECMGFNAGYGGLEGCLLWFDHHELQGGGSDEDWWDSDCMVKDDWQIVVIDALCADAGMISSQSGNKATGVLASKAACQASCEADSSCTHFFYRNSSKADKSYKCATFSSCDGQEPGGVGGYIYQKMATNFRKQAMTGFSNLRTSDQKATMCTKASRQGNMATFANAAFPGTRDFPSLHHKSYSAISRCITAAICDPNDPGSDLGIDDVRAEYSRISGSSALEAMALKVSNSELMNAVMLSCSSCPAKQFAEAVAQIGEELSMLKAVSGWFTTYQFLYVSLNQQLVSAFESMLSVLMLPAQTLIAGSKFHWWKIALKVVSLSAKVLLAKSTGASFRMVSKTMSATAGGIKATMSCFSDLHHCTKGVAYVFKDHSAHLATPSPGMLDNEETVLEFNNLIALLIKYLEVITTSSDAQRDVIASNYGRMKAAASVAMACPISAGKLEAAALKTYGAMQWIGLGILMPKKYVIYWQRDYTQGGGTGCYYNDGDSGHGCKGSYPSWGDDGCWKVDNFVGDECSKWDGSLQGENDGSNTYRCQDEGLPCGGRMCNSASRYFWMAEVGSPSSFPPSVFFKSLADKEGPIQTFVNPAFGTNYSTSAEDGWTAFLSQCQYMPKLYISEVKSGSIQRDQSSPSVKPVDCDIYGITVPTYAFQDCDDMVWAPVKDTVAEQCLNSYAIGWPTPFYFPANQWLTDREMRNQGGFVGWGKAQKDLMAAGTLSGDGRYAKPLPQWYNFNMKTFIPNKPGQFASAGADDGSIYCCTPWLPSKNVSNMFAAKYNTNLDQIAEEKHPECAGVLCDCYSMQESLYELPADDFWGKCSDAATPAFSNSNINDAIITRQMLTTSMGAGCNWIDVIKSGNNFDACTAPDRGSTDSDLPPRCSSARDCSAMDQCVGGDGIQACSSCEKIQCSGSNGLKYCSCNDDSTQGVSYCTSVEQCNGKFCIGGKGPQACHTCDSTQCTNNQCACNNDAGNGGNVNAK
eukprot:TRINITY_DN33104_c0_g1_i1.p1 TRINITY_DN33104_c0_g1~~TRINITY_DN33104_c0_g1_i1.p1  ORF type:complete len:1153 (+),score=175.34 TRINITY_DN33104_c0_g1_i1:158-3616(+)